MKSSVRASLFLPLSEAHSIARRADVAVLLCRRWAFADPSEPPRQSNGGYGSFPCDDCIPDPNIGAKYIRDLYEKAGDTNGWVLT